MKVVFFGTPLFAANVIIYLLQNRVEILAVVTKPDRPQGRSRKPSHSAVKQQLHKTYPDIPILQPEKASTSTFVKTLTPFEADLFVVVSYGEIISQELLDLPKYGCINLHPSLLPRYRGAAPIQSALLDGAKETGVTIIEMTSKMDAGDILIQEKVPISEEMNYQELESELCRVGSSSLLKVIQCYKNLTKVPQDHTQATYVQKIDPTMTQIDWNHDAGNVHNQIRAFSPYPGAWCYIEIGGQQKRLKVYRSRVQNSIGRSPGEILSFTPQGWCVACKRGALLLLEVQLEGKKRLSIEEFYKGISSPIKMKSNYSDPFC